MPDPAARLAALWRRLAPLPGGRRLFDWLLARVVPYSGSTRPRVLALEPGRATVVIPDRRRNRNHLGSVHALAIANVAELASGLAMTLALDPGTKAIVVRLEVDYVKKARGTLTAVGHAEPPRGLTGDTDTTATATVTDAGGEPVAHLTAHWRLRPS